MTVTVTGPQEPTAGCPHPEARGVDLHYGVFGRCGGKYSYAANMKYNIVVKCCYMWSNVLILLSSDSSNLQQGELQCAGGQDTSHAG